ncbi:MAG: tetratricopeptide repeat protein, partial [Gammaproteobacteria bacterium]|nr:tetratricopeptide repeat protein [Gammaproteobacteria bacterium]
MKLSCVSKIPPEEWREIAEEPGYQAFIHGEYRTVWNAPAQTVAVRLTVHAAPSFDAVTKIDFHAPLAELHEESSRRLLHLLTQYKITFSAEEKARALSPKTVFLPAWEQNSRGVWEQQKHSVLTDGDVKSAVVKTWRDYLENAVQLDTGYAEAWKNLGQHFVTVVNFDAAESAFRKALAIKFILGPEHPDTAESLNNLAELYRELADYARAEPLHQRALTVR